MEAKTILKEMEAVKNVGAVMGLNITSWILWMNNANTVLMFASFGVSIGYTVYRLIRDIRKDLNNKNNK